MMYLSLATIFSALVILLSVWSKNRIVKKFNRVEQSYKSMEAISDKRNKLIPTLVDNAKSYLNEKEKLIDRLEKLKLSNDEKNASRQEKAVKQKKIDTAIRQLYQKLTKDKNFKESQHFAILQGTINEMEEQLSASKRSVYSAASDYNNAIEMFPSNIIANFMGYGRSEDIVDEDVLELKELEKNKEYVVIERDNLENKG